MLCSSKTFTYPINTNTNPHKISTIAKFATKCLKNILLKSIDLKKKSLPKVSFYMTERENNDENIGDNAKNRGDTNGHSNDILKFVLNLWKRLVLSFLLLHLSYRTSFPSRLRTKNSLVIPSRFGTLPNSASLDSSD